MAPIKFIVMSICKPFLIRFVIDFAFLILVYLVATWVLIIETCEGKLFKKNECG